MAAAANPDVVDTDLECPVCHEDYQEPKILPCAHLACRKCILSWLRSPRSQGGCPLCRDPILPSSSSPPHAGSLDNQVDALPTDLAIQSVVETQKFLNPPHVCSLCDGSVAATSFCLQCTIKCCTSCAKGHKRVPLLQHHAIDDLKNLSAERLAENCHMTCKAHPDRLVELYCFSHQELICMLCFPTIHRECGDVKAVTDAAREWRAELKNRAKGLLKQEAQLASQMQTVKDEFKTLREKVDDVFDGLENLLQKRRQAVMNTIQAEETAKVATFSDMEKDRAAFKAHARTVKKLASTAANDALLGMRGKVTSRLQGLERTTGAKDQAETPLEVTFDVQELHRLTESISALGEVSKETQKSFHRRPVSSGIFARILPPPPRSTLPSSSLTSPTPSAAAAAAAAVSPSQVAARPIKQLTALDLNHGDRVKRGFGWISGDVDGKGPGTVEARSCLCRKRRNRGVITVLWDKTDRRGRHNMGPGGVYELEHL